MFKCPRYQVSCRFGVIHIQQIRNFFVFHIIYISQAYGFSLPEPAEEVPLFLSRLKSEAYPAPLGANDILLTADTVVISDGEVLGKPCDRGQAAQMLRRLSGRRHTVVSGVTLRTAGRMHTFSAESGVWFRPLSEEEIGYYLDTFAPYDKAGSYGIQEWIGYAAIEKINGSFYNVMGLPVQRLYVELDRFLSLQAG